MGGLGDTPRAETDGSDFTGSAARFPLTGVNFSSVATCCDSVEQEVLINQSQDNCLDHITIVEDN